MNSDHKTQSREYRANCAVLTVSDTRTESDDRSGQLIMEMLEQSGHSVKGYAIVKDNPADVEDQLLDWLRSSKTPVLPLDKSGKPAGDAGSGNGGMGSAIPSKAQAEINVIITTGGTGIARRDRTVEVVSRLLQKELEGFGELFRMLSYKEVGASAMLSRAVAGLACSAGHETFIFSMPGSVNAVRLGMEKLILPELPHLLWERQR
ncbi:Molybdenum cofactor biosynthesis protein B [Poriferisphaera corsica]|uniref:Molybdenum cofactor biosynthesis protein B n=1 Tax=Poriferisphaera corsica TaxID=2528020 RepID=A0A517YVB0_9BACT|nr:MogA/MoaB family molybdenum cofactor biosynthesis protein [Poriferisphaera corsica]QDU34112.1 Molybdenum cofactor biosynthesis protein B [Poriferisphaera corsica]